MNVTISGQEHEITAEQVLAAMHRREREPVVTGTHYVSIRRRRFPAKQVIRVTLGIPGQSLQTNQAVSILTRLGFTTGQQD